MAIVVSRPKQYADRVRAYKLFIDGQPAAEIKGGQEIRLEVPQNGKKLLAKIDWCTSNELDLSTVHNDDKIEIMNAMRGKQWIPFYVFYAITFGRKQYLQLRTIV